MTTEANVSAADLIRRIAEMERKGQSDDDDYRDLVAELAERLEDLPTAEIGALVKRSPDLEDDDGYWTPIQVLRERADPATFELCKQWSSSPMPLMREAAVDVLGQLGAQDGLPFAAQSAPLVRALLADTDLDVLASAVMAAGHLDILKPAELAAFARHESNEVRFSAVHALMGNEDKVSIGSLSALCRDQDRDVRNWAVFSLGQQTDADTPEIRAALLASLAEEDAEIRGEALIGLSRRGDMRVLEPLKREIAGEFQGAWCIEAAAALADASLTPLLAELRNRLSPEDLDAFGSDLEEAMEACSED
jgi:HEAT repeat protein